MYTITSGIFIHFGHHVRGHDGPCISLHGHTWKFDVSLQAKELDKSGFVVDFDKREDSRPWIQGHIRAPKETFRQEIEASGFGFVEELSIDDMVDNFMIRFSRP